MTASTEGFVLQTGSRAWRAAVELVSSMRFAISLLTVICIASVIGTVLKQHEPYGNYVNQFGPFWAEVFATVSLYNVYSAWWFLLILAFLVLSTSLCVARNSPKILKDLRSYKENLREQSLLAFGHRAQASMEEAPEGASHRIGRLLTSGGWKVKLQQRDGGGWMLAAKIGSANKLGYIAAHSAIILICVGGLLDGDLVVRAQMLFNGKTPYTGGGMIADVPVQHRLSERNPTFRGNVLVSEGTQSSTATLSQSDGVLLQELPFAIELKKFIVEYYSTGMPKLFASEVVIHDLATGEAKPARVEVNHPANFKGIEIYQSSFDDGGSSLELRAMPIRGHGKPFDLQGTVGGSSKLVAQGGVQELSVEYTGLRVINVENFAQETAATDVRKVDLRASLDARMGAANKTHENKNLRNVGPSVSYKLRDSAGQAREFSNYMLPVDMGDGSPVYLLGMRESPSEPFRYLRVPVDANGSMDEFFRLSGALSDAAMRERAVKRYASKSVDAKRPELVDQLAASSARALALFAGKGPQNSGSPPVAGLQAISDFIEANVPESERNKAGEVLIRILNGTLFELAQVARESEGLKPLVAETSTQQFMTQAVLALSDVPLYPAPVVLQLTNFNQVQASVFQVARAPGKKVVYLGCALLILGIFAMLYIRERRLWVWFAPVTTGNHVTSQVTMAMSMNRKTMDGDREFEQLKDKVLGLTD
ncbi:cytochrome c biogenesis protein ResB [Rhodoferax aquaticus]|uniref:Cytochrome c biogenesis protein ResB n=1 Tax=Rhodoferax aquaticus TaxID=2527691 RepID=A0A515ET41_9BURK|nr:cytochrome c biogenesis protein ResB [Rhodoferax aquaticus]QDL55798.1 cytochrome c biogenesis protein ResB [Rhodoferax aquaticus]